MKTANQSPKCENKFSTATLSTIQRLPQYVVNRIAAGEVIQRPANAIKELIENSLDAGSSQIKVTVRDGGLKVIQIQDNGCGIRLDDYPILCERFTTSKLTDFSDLAKLNTFGFRGEALASLSHVSLVTISSRTSGQTCAYKAKYRGGLMDGKPVACAGNLGTTIQAEDLFYNAPMRRKAFKSARDEFVRVADVVSQYAIHYAPKCGFHLHSANSNNNSHEQDLRTSAGWSRMDAVRTVIGSNIVENLISLSSSHGCTSESTRMAVEHFGLRYEGLLTAPNQITSTCVPSLKLNLFINDRLIDHCLLIRRALENAYSTVLSRALKPGSTCTMGGTSTTTRRKLSVMTNAIYRSSHAQLLYVYLNLQLPPNTLDVNVHPTKSEIHFLHEDEIVTALQDAVEHCLLSSAQIRKFITSSLPAPNRQPTNSPYCSASPSTTAVRPQGKVRIDVREQKLERFIIPNSNSARQFTSTEIESVVDDLSATTDEVEHVQLGADQSPDLEFDQEFGGCFSDSLDCGDREKDDCISMESSRIESSSQQRTLDEIIPSDCNSQLSNPTAKVAVNLSDSSSDCDSLSGRPIVSKSTSRDYLTSSRSIESGGATIKRRRTVNLMSVLALKRNLESNVNTDLGNLLRTSKFIGSIDRTKCVVQHATELLLVRLVPLSRALFYQLLVVNFANHGEIVLDEPAPLKELLLIGMQHVQSKALRVDQSLKPNDFSDDFLNDSIATLLKYAPMLWDYFSIRIMSNAAGEAMLYGIPLILANYIPDLEKLPIFTAYLVTRVNWTIESVCLENICCIMANFYGISEPIATHGTNDEFGKNVITFSCGEQSQSEFDKSDIKLSRQWILEHSLWPAISSLLVSSNNFPNCSIFTEINDMNKENRNVNLQSAFVLLTSLSDLYKVFERC